MEKPIFDHGPGSIESVETHMARIPSKQELEQIREVAQSHAYRSEEPRGDRLRWAKLSLAANKRFHGDDPQAQARMRQQELMLRTWIIEHLGPDADSDWNPQALAEDTLAALTLEPGEAEAASADWRELPIEQIRLLRHHKNLTGHVDRLIPRLEPGQIKDQLAKWASVRAHLP
ncbi:hypothetical protein ABH931_002752 [Streptacidiphilus sp. MAP12-33]|uniref:hypothetical protein n=1 Tax=Streptacidiphilus sp. MAP12-33 TaxID=3156266 RepID=UPI00351316CC